MVIHEQDSGFLQWGLRLLDAGPVYNSGYYGDVIHHDTDNTYYAQYYRDHYDTECSHVDNDETIAHALQEEFSRLAVTETAGYSHAGEEQYHAPISEQDWHIPSTGNYISVHEDCQDEDDVGPSSSCSSTDYAYEYPNSLELSDEYMLDGETGKRLNEMIPIPHVPRINGEIPSTDEATSDYQRLLDRLQVYNLVERKVQGDGNCQFCSLSDQLYRTPEHHKFVRQKIVNQLKSHSESYEGYVPMAYSDYLKMMSKSGEWGDHVTLQAAADSYGMKIFVITSFKDTCYIEILPNIQKSKRVIFLSFWAEVHYNSIHPPEVQYNPIDSPEKGDMSSGEFRKKKKWWIFGSNH